MVLLCIVPWAALAVLSGAGPGEKAAGHLGAWVTVTTALCPNIGGQCHYYTVSYYRGLNATTTLCPNTGG